MVWISAMVGGTSLNILCKTSRKIVIGRELIFVISGSVISINQGITLILIWVSIHPKCHGMMWQCKSKVVVFMISPDISLITGILLTFKPK